MARGGLRPGAGRKPGGVAKLAKAAAIAPALTGQTPLAFLESIVRDAKQSTKDRVDAAKAMLPYCHRRLPQEIEHTGKDGAAIALIVDTGLVAVRESKPDST